MNFQYKNPLFATVLLLLFLPVYQTYAQSGSHGPIISKIDSLIQSEVNQKHIPGAVILIEKDGKVLHRKAFGYAYEFDYHMKRLKHPVNMQVNTMFDLASLTKVFATTFGIMQLVGEGKIHLDTPVHEYLPEFHGPHKDSVTVRQLLNHTSGLNEWQPLYYEASNSKETYREICHMPLKYAVGAARHYSDLGFMMLGYLIHHITGQPINQYLEEHLYKPLGLHHTTYNPLKEGFTNIAATSHGNPFEKKMVYDDHFGYKCDVDPHSWNGWRRYTLKGRVSDGNAWYANQGIAGHAGLFSTISDLQKLVELMLNEGVYKGRRYIKASVIREFTTKDRYGNGLGWDMAPDVIMADGAPNDAYGHTGFTGTNVVVIPDYHLFYILLTNRENAGVSKEGYYFNLNPLRHKISALVLNGFGHN
ncbi:MAG TPA: serine hydrolase [Balneolales bacterium]|nr:serine hydrolase [Balneolales bacterium]